MISRSQHPESLVLFLALPLEALVFLLLRLLLSALRSFACSNAISSGLSKSWSYASSMIRICAGASGLPVLGCCLTAVAAGVSLGVISLLTTLLWLLTYWCRPWLMFCRAKRVALRFLTRSGLSAARGRREGSPSFSALFSRYFLRMLKSVLLFSKALF